MQQLVLHSASQPFRFRPQDGGTEACHDLRNQSRSPVHVKWEMIRFGYSSIVEVFISVWQKVSNMTVCLCQKDYSMSACYSLTYCFNDLR